MNPTEKLRIEEDEWSIDQDIKGIIDEILNSPFAPNPVHVVFLRRIASALQGIRNDLTKQLKAKRELADELKKELKIHIKKMGCMKCSGTIVISKHIQARREGRGNNAKEI